MKTALYVVACVALTALFVACASQPVGQYSAAQVQQGLKDAVGQGLVSQPQADAVAGKIANASTGFDWGALGGAVLTGAGTLAAAYIGLKPALGRTDNKNILGPEAAAVLDELVAARKAA